MFHVTLPVMEPLCALIWFSALIISLLFLLGNQSWKGLLSWWSIRAHTAVLMLFPSSVVFLFHPSLNVLFIWPSFFWEAVISFMKNKLHILISKGLPNISIEFPHLLISSFTYNQKLIICTYINKWKSVPIDLCKNKGAFIHPIPNL